MKKLLILISIFLLLVSCQKNNIETDNFKLKIETSIVPLASIANYIWGNFVEAHSIIPAWISPHGFDPKPQNMVDIQNADLIVFIWLEHIDWFLDKVLDDKNTLKVSEWIELINWFIEDEHEYEWEEEYHEQDPHIWTSPINAKIIAEKIAVKLGEILPEQKEFLQNNLENFRDEIDETLDVFKVETEWKNPHYFIVFHDAYNYLLQQDLKVPFENKLVFQARVLSEQSLDEMKHLIDEIQEYDIWIAFKEPQFNDWNLQELAKEYNLKILDLDPLWRDESSSWYVKNLKNNLDNLKMIYE
jgi:zinc transport system substrate-binding protein